MNTFLQQWAEAAHTSLGFFWMALWAFALGYLISSLIQVLVTRERMQRSMGESGAKSVGIAIFFGFISSSCSFAALSTTRALFQKGAGLIPSLAFLLASTNLVVELGIVIAIFLSWQFVVGEYIGGLMLIALAWILVKLTHPDQLVSKVREKLSDDEDDDGQDSKSWKTKLFSLEGWQNIASQYVMEWQMVWKDVLIGFTVAGIISAFVPDSFFETLFVGSSSSGHTDLAFWQVLLQTLVGPIAAFFTFIGSMGNIPLAAVLFDHGVSFAGVMAFIFSDLVVLPVLRINARYYGWRLALYILAVLLACLVATSLMLHYGLAMLDMLPSASIGGQSVTDREMFSLDYGFYLNLLFLLVSAGLIGLWKQAKSGSHHHHQNGRSWKEKLILGLCAIAVIWLLAGMALKLGT